MLLTIATLSPLLAAPQEAETLFVVTSLPYIADVARHIGADDVEAVALVAPGVDPHFVEVTPSQLESMRRADLFLENGMQLEAWAPQVLAAAGRPDLAQGAKAHAFVTTGIVPVEVPTHEELHSDAHVHAAGNPHVWLDPLNLKIVASNVAEALSRVAPERRDAFAARRVQFEERIDAAFFGEELRALLGGRTLDRLHRSGRLIEFLEKRKVDGKPLIGKLGGWLARGRALSGQKLVSYHRTWSYFERSLGLEVVATLEEKPGIPPGPAYVRS